MVELISNLFRDSLLGTVYFPFWWYSKGLVLVGSKLTSSVADFNDGVGFSIWLKNIFTPLYNQRDWAGRFVSFFVRVVNIIIRGLIMILIIAVHLILMMLWIVLPIFVVIKIFS